MQSLAINQPSTGVLCREFLSAHLAPSTPVVMSGSGYDGAPASSVLGGLLYDEEERSLLKPPSEKAVAPSAAAAATKDGGSNRSKVNDNDSSTVDASLDVSTRATAAAVVPGGPEPEAVSMRDCGGNACASVAATAENSEKEELLEEVESDGGVGRRAPDVDVCTVGDLYPWRNMYGATERGEQLRLGFLRQQVIVM